jgi:hydrogenase-4 component B
MEALLSAVAVQLAGGTAALLLARKPWAATLTGAGAAVLGCVLGIAPAARILLAGGSESLKLAWDPLHGAFHVAIDPLSAFFLLPVFGLSALAAIYGASYLFSYRHEKNLGVPWFFFNVFVAGMTMVLLARTVLVFLISWETMSLAAYCLVTFEHEKSEVRRAGWIYLVATHLGVVFLFSAFLVLGGNAGGLDFDALRALSGLDGLTSGLIFVLAVIGFGAKAGFVPFHVWLPEAHPAAPSHVSALMSGVMIKMGLYGILRIQTLLGPPAPWQGWTLAGIGMATALLGIALAVHQRDLKRVLAYSSIENVGLITLSLGVGLWGWASRAPTVAALGMSAALLHIWNHALMKGLLFFAAGSVLHGTGTKDMEKLGGLMKRMPWTGSAMVVGAVAISALPPLNGFVSKWLVYLSVLEWGMPASNNGGLPALLGVGLLAMIGGLAALAFVRLIGLTLLGAPRSPAALHAHESSPWMLGPMQILVVLCLAAAVVPQTATACLANVWGQVLGAAGTDRFVEVDQVEARLATIGNLNAFTWLALLGATGALLTLTRNRARSAGLTWGCGYVAPTARMQYSGRSFAELLAEHLLPRFLRPRTRRQAPHGLFPSQGEFASESPDPFEQKIYEPFFRRWAERFARLRILQQGKVHIYLVYIMVTVVLALTWASLRTWMWGTS